MVWLQLWKSNAISSLSIPSIKKNAVSGIGIEKLKVEDIFSFCNSAQQKNFKMSHIPAFSNSSAFFHNS